MTTDQLKAIKARYEAATEGPWKYGSDTNKQIIYPTPFLNAKNKIAELGIYDIANCDFIAHARTDIPALCKEVERLRGAVEATRDCMLANGEQCPDLKRPCEKCDLNTYPAAVHSALEQK